MRNLEVSLIEWEGPENSAPRLLGRTTDPDLVEAVRSRLAASRRRDLVRLAPPVRVVPDARNEPADD
jgi:hypothetical protein